MAGIFSWYNAQLLRNPVATKTITAVTIACCGDIACQKLEGAAVVDKHRTGRMAAWVRRRLRGGGTRWLACGRASRSFPQAAAARAFSRAGHADDPPCALLVRLSRPPLPALDGEARHCGPGAGVAAAHGPAAVRRCCSIRGARIACCGVCRARSHPSALWASSTVRGGER